MTDFWTTDLWENPSNTGRCSEPRTTRTSLIVGNHPYVYSTIRAVYQNFSGTPNIRSAGTHICRIAGKPRRFPGDLPTKGACVVVPSTAGRPSAPVQPAMSLAVQLAVLLAAQLAVQMAVQPAVQPAVQLAVQLAVQWRCSWRCSKLWNWLCNLLCLNES